MNNGLCIRTRLSQLGEKLNAGKALYQDTTSQLAEKTLARHRKCQGTTLVVPIKPIK
jgi:hypothetical protein